MTNIVARLLAFAFLSGMTIAPTTQAQEKKITRDQLPPAVEKTVAEQSRGARINGFATEIDKGMKVYEVELTVDGHSKDITMDKNGKIVEVEEEVAMESLSPEVKAALTKAAGSGTIMKVESLTQAVKLVAYEASVKNGAKVSEVQVGPSGEKLAHNL